MSQYHHLIILEREGIFLLHEEYEKVSQGAKQRYPSDRSCLERGQ